MDLESAVMDIIVSSGAARSYAYEALAKAKTGAFTDAEELMKSSHEAAKAAHSIQTKLIENDEGQGKNPMTLIMVHAQDHLMTSLLAQEMVQELMILHHRLEKIAQS